MEKVAKVGRVKAQKRSNDSSTEVPEKKFKKISKGSGSPKKIKIEINGAGKTLENLEVTNEHVVKCVDAILILAEGHSKKTTFLSEDEKIYLQINTIKVPKVSQRCLRILLPHKLVGPNDDVALIVPDIAKGLRQDYEKSVDHWETILREKGVTQIKDILPMNQIKTEYHQYEMQRKLAKLYDFFLVDGRIAGHMSHLLGQSFMRFANSPVPIKLSKENLKDEIDFGLKKVSLGIHGKGTTHSVQVATSSMKKKKIVENIIAAYEKLQKLYPGGWSNIRSIYVKTKQGLGIPIYYTMKNRNQVVVPVVAPKRPKAYKTVEGELSTLEGDATVRVAPGGHVKVEVKKTTKEEDEDNVVAEIEKVDVKSVKVKKTSGDKKNVKKAATKGGIVKKTKTKKAKDVEKVVEKKEKVKDVEKVVEKKEKVKDVEKVVEKKEKVKDVEKVVEKKEKVKNGAEKKESVKIGAEKKTRVKKLKEEPEINSMKVKVTKVSKVERVKINKKNTKPVETKAKTEKKLKMKKEKK